MILLESIADTAYILMSFTGGLYVSSYIKNNTILDLLDYS
jgi:hypothetical protein